MLTQKIAFVIFSRGWGVTILKTMCTKLGYSGIAYCHQNHLPNHCISGVNQCCLSSGWQWITTARGQFPRQKTIPFDPGRVCTCRPATIYKPWWWYTLAGWLWLTSLTAEGDSTAHSLCMCHIKNSNASVVGNIMNAIICEGVSCSYSLHFLNNYALLEVAFVSSTYLPHSIVTHTALVL